MRTLRWVVAAAVPLAVASPGVPVHAALPMRYWVEYAGSGTVAFACHNVAVTTGTSPQTGTAARVSCSLNGFPSAEVLDGGSHATSAGLANAALGSTVRVCIFASSVYGFPHMTYYSVDVCRDVTLAAAGTVYL